MTKREVKGAAGGEKRTDGKTRREKSHLMTISIVTVRTPTASSGEEAPKLETEAEKLLSVHVSGSVTSESSPARASFQANVYVCTCKGDA